MDRFTHICLMVTICFLVCVYGVIARADNFAYCDQDLPDFCDEIRFVKSCSFAKKHERPYPSYLKYSYKPSVKNNYCEGLDVQFLAKQRRAPVIWLSSLTLGKIEFAPPDKRADISAPLVQVPVNVVGSSGRNLKGYQFDALIEGGQTLGWNLSRVIIDRGIPAEWLRFVGYISRDGTYTAVKISRAKGTKPVSTPASSRKLYVFAEFREPVSKVQWRWLALKKGACGSVLSQFSDAYVGKVKVPTVQFEIDIPSEKHVCIEVLAWDLQQLGGGSKDDPISRKFKLKLGRP